jgi:N-acetylglutamate synthase-like GNAT family acetyltransferase
LFRCNRIHSRNAMRWQTCPVEIRRARANDAPSIAALLTELGYSSSATEVEDRLGCLDGSDCVLITAGGLIALHRVPRVAEGSPFARITALVVTADRRGQGIAHALLRAALVAICFPPTVGG